MYTQPTHFIVQTSSANMPAKCWGQYGNVAVLEVDLDRQHVSSISTRARGCHRIVEYWGRLNVGKTERCAFERARADAEVLAAELNSRKFHG